MQSRGWITLVGSIALIVIALLLMYGSPVSTIYLPHGENLQIE